MVKGVHYPKFDLNLSRANHFVVRILPSICNSLKIRNGLSPINNQNFGLYSKKKKHQSC